MASAFLAHPLTTLDDSAEKMSPVSSMAFAPDTAVPSDEELAEAFSVLAREEYERVFQFLAKQVRQRHEAEDLTQRTFIRAYRTFSRFDQSRPFAPWVFTIARRELVDFYRRYRLEMTEIEETHAVANEASADVQVARSDDAARLWRLAEKLSPKQHQVLLLHYSEGFSLLEVAKIMGLTHVHVKVLVHRARQRLQKAWHWKEEELSR